MSRHNNTYNNTPAQMFISAFSISFCLTINTVWYIPVFDMLTSRLQGESLIHTHQFNRCPPVALFWVMLNDLLFMGRWFENCLKPNTSDWTDRKYIYIHFWLLVRCLCNNQCQSFCLAQLPWNHKTAGRKNTDDSDASVKLNGFSARMIQGDYE